MKPTPFCYVTASHWRLSVLVTLLFMLLSIPAGCGSAGRTKRSPKSDVDDPVEPLAARQGLADSVDSAKTGESANDFKFDRQAEMTRADELVGKRDFAGAASSLRKSLLVEPGDVEILFRLANVEAASGNLPTAIDLLGEIPRDHPEAGLPALGQSADWCFLSERYDEAEQRYVKVLERAPHVAQARRQLAYMLNRRGRRQEASLHLQELCKQGNVRLDELQALIVLNDAIYDDPSKSEKRSQGDAPYWPIGPGGEARYLFGKKKFEQVVTILQPMVAGGDVHPAVLALYGRAVAESQDEQRFVWWLSRTDKRTREFGDYWAALGTFEVGKRRYTHATRALAEAIDRDPTDFISMARLRQCLSTLGDAATSKRWGDRWRTTRETVLANIRLSQAESLNPDTIAELASLLFQLDRPLEATLWKSIEASKRGLPQSELLKLNAERQQLVASGIGFPARSDRLCGMDVGQYPLPMLEVSPSSEPPLSEPVATQSNIDGGVAIPASFSNVAQQFGLSHTYLVASQPQEQQYSIYQTLGGGVAALDYDRDGRTDLYFAQGGADSPSFQGERTNQLFRHTEDKLVDVTRVSNTILSQYSIGLTAGDWNQDGFADVVVANIGSNLLLINNGDGTFTRQALSKQARATIVPASIAMADINGDALPDIIQTAYVDDANLDRKPPLDDSGRVRHRVSPGDFDPGADWFLENDGSGGIGQGPFQMQSHGVYPGLGVIVTDLNGQPGNEIFVGNDLFPNQLWVRDSTTGQWSDAAAALGCAYGFSGLATGSMGIATGDFDRNGTLDIHITNYEAENASLFMSQSGAYQDRNVHYQLARPSNLLVGFGTQAIDYDNDGDLDLIVTNGHLDDSIQNIAPFKQPAQLLCNRGGRFGLAEVTDPSRYWNSDHLGRGLARLDFNRDGKSDFVITHIGEPSALLLNQTSTDYHWLQLQLVGTRSERDSIGTRICIHYDERESTDWVVAGDGYLSHNESTVSFGLRQATSVDEMEIHWPSGERQTFYDIPAGRCYLVVENRGTPYPL